MKLYDIVRLYQDDRCCLRRRVIKRGLTLREAREHCDDPEHNAISARSAAGKRRTAALGLWADTYRPARPMKAGRRR